MLRRDINNMTREDRRRQLEQIKNGPDGWQGILDTYVRTMLMKQGIAGTLGVMMDEMIEEILSVEFPKQD
jgi:hypothetical protein